jgi:predicted NBD/HSP70 family sugar kinase
LANKDATSYIAVHRELRHRCTTTSPTLKRFFAASKQSMSNRFDRLAEIGAAEIVPGRYREAAPLWRVSPDFAYNLVLSVKRTAIVGQVLDMAYLPVGERAEQPVPWQGSGETEGRGDALIKALVKVAKDAVAEAEKEGSERPDPVQRESPLSFRERILGTAVALPTPVHRIRIREGDDVRWEMRSASRWIMPELRAMPEGANLYEVLRGALLGEGLPAERLSLINDASAAALGLVVDVRMSSEYRPPRDMILLWLAEGVGGGIISGHRLVTGSAGFAGEIGHLAVRPDGVLCRHCGVRGCLETIASSGALDRELRAAFEGAGIGNSEEWTGRPLIELANGEIRPHPAYTEAMREAGWWAGIALAQLVNVLNPQLIVLMDQHDANLPVHEIDRPAPVRDEQFQRSLEAALRRNSLDPAYRHIQNHDGPRDLYGLQYGVHSIEPHGVDATPVRASILPMIGAAADLIDFFGDDFFKSSIEKGHGATPQRRGRKASGAAAAAALRPVP